MRASGINLHHINNVKIKYIERYFTYRYHRGVKAVVLQRELSALQAILAEAGQSIKADPEHPRLNPQALGIAGSRPEVICPYCNCSALLVKGCEIYPHRAELAEQFYWICPQCKAYSGCHKGQGRPRGTLANEELRRLRRKVHWLFDPTWKNAGIQREDGYVWLARKLNIPYIAAISGYLMLSYVKELLKCCNPIKSLRIINAFLIRLCCQLSTYPRGNKPVSESQPRGLANGSGR